MALCKLFFVSGHVQGVWYRASTQRKAQALNITGYAKNLPDGRVEVLACGDADALEALQSWLHEGPPNAEVKSVEGDDVTSYTLHSFITM